MAVLERRVPKAALEYIVPKNEIREVRD